MIQYKIAWWTFQSFSFERVFLLGASDTKLKLPFSITTITIAVTEAYNHNNAIFYIQKNRFLKDDSVDYVKVHTWRLSLKVTRSFAYLLVKVPLNFVASNLNTFGST